jgi:hypothetical protein
MKGSSCSAQPKRMSQVGASRLPDRAGRAVYGTPHQKPSVSELRPNDSCQVRK